ncbi:MAG TPA: hypothetical protein VH835_04350 [Dongiaceae bacterium]|jgi:hypothetical protein
MNAWVVGSVVFVCVFGGALLGMYLRPRLPQTNLSEETKDTVKLGMGLVATMAALVLGLLVATAKGSYDDQKSGFDQISANLILLDSMLAQYGPETQQARLRLRDIVAIGISRIWPEDAEGSPSLVPTTTAEGESLSNIILGLAPADDRQRHLLPTIMQISMEVGRARWLLAAQDQGAPIPKTFLVIVIFWLTVLFASFGLLAPRNLTAIGTLCLSALSVSGAIFLILELAQPFQGLVQISSTPLRTALSLIAQ